MKKSQHYQWLSSPVLLGGAMLVLAGAACTPVTVVTTTATAATAVAEERTLGNMLDDTSIRAQILHRFVQSDVNDLLTGVDVEVREARVMLTGSVVQEHTMIDAVRLSWEVPGVREVVNEIVVTGNSYPLSIRAKDSWITAQVKAKLLAEKTIRSVNYAIETVQGTVYMFGVALSQQELEHAANIASRVRGVQRVVSHVRTKDSPYREGLEGAP
jgi:osmotically-inducible protein OsmY